MDVAAERGRAAVAAVPLVLVPALGLAQGGFLPGSWVWAGAIAAWGAAMAVIFSPDGGLTRRAWQWVAAVTALLLWTLLSATWSVRPAQSVLEARRTLVYVATILALVLLVRRGATRVLVLATTVATAGIVLYALARHLLSERQTVPFESYLLNEPLGYANAVGILAAMTMLLALGVATQSESRAWRAAGAALVPPLALAVLLTGSTASWLALGIGFAASALIDREPVGLLLSLAATALPAGALVLLGHLSRFTDETTESPRIGGWLLALLACAAAAAAAVLLRWLQARRASLPWSPSRRPVVGAVIAIALCGTVLAVHSGSSEPRASYWHIAWHDQYRTHELLGSGGGTFAYYWEASARQVDLGGALDSHSLYVETLSELGPIGLLLLLAVLLMPFRAVRSRAAFVPAALGAYVAFLVHAGLDWDWEMPAVVVAALCCGAAALSADVPPGRPLGSTARVALVVTAVVLAAAALAGARSDTERSAETTKAPPGGAFA